MSRVFSASWVLRPRLGCGGGRGPGLIVAVSKKAPGLASFLAARTRKKALSSIHRAAQLAMGSGASAGPCAAAAAGECVFGSVFVDISACGMPLAPPLLWPCLLLPMPKGMAAGHQQALLAQAEQRRIRGR